ncbi:hypothetical protein SLEP1_g13126 [Rubroshorea leprosula]|uniref:Wall-associated receptor kinase galacturonan-binding domain-containing protein n=1 Tax=Rubroshorea leprosula TaxID=152421 RepID=A0AAV5IPI0_9ROSI|nr:hypothetical protein SLEP1_g13126 [Rubroshorea leprosula]
MARPAGLIFQLLLLALFHVPCSSAKDNQHQHCPPSSCGHIPNISSPFWLNTNQHNCKGLQGYNLSCENNHTVLYSGSAKFYVQAINYFNQTIRLVDSGIQKGSCSSIPHFSFDTVTFPWNLYSSFYDYDYDSISVSDILFISCENPVNATDLYVDASGCVNASSFSTSYQPESNGSKRCYYVKIGWTTPLELKSSCRIELMSLFPFSREKNYRNFSYLDVHRQLEYGFELSWKKAPDYIVSLVWPRTNGELLLSKYL